MSDKSSPFEGEIVILCYTECDYEGEGTAALVYKVIGGKLKPLYGVMRLPDGTCWDQYGENQYEDALGCIVKASAKEVYAPMFSPDGQAFFGERLGFQELSDELNEQGELECWFELGSFFNREFYSLLKERGIKILEINPETFEVDEVNW